MKRSVFVFVLVVFGLLIIANNYTEASSDFCKEYTARISGKGDGDELPPIYLNGTNLKVELADGENYDLVGEVVYIDAIPYFKADRKLHPWLANSKRLRDPYYPVNTVDDTLLKELEGRKIRCAFRAKGSIGYNRSGKIDYILTLFPANKTK